MVARARPAVQNATVHRRKGTLHRPRTFRIVGGYGMLAAAMKRRDFLAASMLGSLGLWMRESPLEAMNPDSGGTNLQTVTRGKRRILIAGGGYGEPFIRYMASLTGKPRPRLCYLPTASADRPDGIITWFKTCVKIDAVPFVQESFIASTRQSQGWDEVLLSMDGIVASGGNTLNQQAIWKAHGIDVILRQAWDRGIILGGASAGSLCWFEEGTTDSRPKELTTVKCLGFLKGSHCPHYDREAQRRPLYQKLIASGEMKPGYACDNDAGIYFEDNDVRRVVATRADAKVYYVSRVDGKAVEKVLEPERIE
jgi:dipeptidase E